MTALQFTGVTTQFSEGLTNTRNLFGMTAPSKSGRLPGKSKSVDSSLCTRTYVED
jgi:hypothetical protein